MTTSERLQKINEAVENWVDAKRKTDKTAEMLLDMDDGHAVSVEIKCNGRTFTLYRVEGLALYSLVHNILKIGHEISKADYTKSEGELNKAWNKTRGEA